MATRSCREHPLPSNIQVRPEVNSVTAGSLRMPLRRRASRVPRMRTKLPGPRPVPPSSLQRGQLSRAHGGREAAGERGRGAPGGEAAVPRQEGPRSPRREAAVPRGSRGRSSRSLTTKVTRPKSVSCTRYVMTINEVEFRQIFQSLYLRLQLLPGNSGPHFRRSSTNTCNEQ